MKATGSYPLEYVMKWSKCLMNQTFDNMGGNAEDIAFRPMHVKPFYVYVMKGFLFVAGGCAWRGNLASEILILLYFKLMRRNEIICLQ